jgi:hypothetical protein
MERSLRQAGLTEPEVSISYVEAITRDPLTGEAKGFVPNGAATAGRSGTGQLT